MAHLSLNLFDDYFDYKKKESGYRSALVREGIRARTVKCPYLLSGEATLSQLFCAAAAFGCLAAIPGGIILLCRGWPILVIAGVTAALGLSYSGGPLSLSYHGLGELTVGVIFGPMLMTGVYYSACGKFDWGVLWLAVGLGMLVANILYTHSVLDLEADIRAEKHTLAAALKGTGSRYLASAVLTLCPCLLVAAMVLAGHLNRWFLLTLLTLPWSIQLLISIWKHLKDSSAFKRPLGWWGTMEYWQAIESEGIDWFMFRWYLARNILVAFGGLCCLAALLP